jgi:hypothetical protein
LTHPEQVAEVHPERGRIMTQRAFAVGLVAILLSSCKGSEGGGSSEVKVVNGRSIAANAAVPGADAEVSLASVSGGGFSYFCSANIVAPRWILTAQHCVDGQTEDSFRVVFAFDVGTARVNRANTWRKVAAIHRAPGYVTPTKAEHDWHPEFGPDGRYQIRLKADVALLELTEDIPAGYAPALIPKESGLSVGETLTFIGYGASLPNFRGGGSRRTTALKYTGRSFDGGTVAEVATRVYMLEKTVDNEYMCRGDSGGGAFRERDGKTYLVAVNSYAKGSNKPGYDYYDCESGWAHVFYTPDYRPWMQSVMGAALPEG